MTPLLSAIFDPPPPGVAPTMAPLVIMVVLVMAAISFISMVLWLSATPVEPPDDQEDDE